MTNSETLKTKTSRRVLRRIGAVLAGLLAVVILDVGIDVVLHATAYRMVDGITGGYIVARLAPDRPVLHALALGIIGLVLSTAGVVGTWNQGPEFGPKWYPLALVVVALPCALMSGILRVRQRWYRTASG